MIWRNLKGNTGLEDFLPCAVPWGEHEADRKDKWRERLALLDGTGGMNREVRF